MGELIRREAARKPLPFSGERLTASITGQVEIEHYHRYLLAREFCRGVDVLDIASGEGYGTALLSQVARSAVGVDIDADAVAAARREFERPNLCYEQGNALQIPLADGSVDVVVSFETLEHFQEHDQFFGEIRRVLRSRGMLIISTPDRDTYSPFNTSPNPFHVKELTGSEFETLIKQHFASYAVTAQRSIIGSVILRPGERVPLWAFEKRGDERIESSNHFARAPYLLAFASDGDLPSLPNSVLIHRSDLDTDTRARLEAELARLEAEEKFTKTLEVVSSLERAKVEAEADVAQARYDVAHANGRLAVARAFIGKVEARLRDSEARVEIDASIIADLREQLRLTKQNQAQVAHHVKLLETSTSWHLTSPLRKIGAKVTLLSRTSRHIRELIWRNSRLPLESPLLRLKRLDDETQRSIPQPADIIIPTSITPMVSIIISTYGQVDMTLFCLQSIMEHLPVCSLEVILIDDAYPDAEDGSLLANIRGVTFIRNTSNLGFLLSCNRAASLAKGRYIYLLNNDTELCAGSIDALVDILETRADVGMVGSKLLYPDGRLQEAGSILWSDASGWNFGRGSDASRPEYNYLRQVDYCSGASVMIARELFNTLGGFDPALAPAYYEDADLALRLHANGLKVLYEPRSVIIHHEGASHGTDIKMGVKAHQVVNQARMVEQWASVLECEHFNGPENLMRARDYGRNRKSILIIDHYCPEPDRDAGSRSVLGIIKSLVNANWIVKFWPYNRIYSPVYTVALEKMGVEVLDHRLPGHLTDWLNRNGATLDHVLISRPHIAAEVLHAVTAGTGAILSFYGVDLHFARLRREARLAESVNATELLAEADRWEAIERRVWRRVDVVFYPSEAEAETVRHMAPQTLSYGIVPFTFPVSPERSAPPFGRTILFVAGFAHPPNVDAAIFLINQILPELKRKIGPVKVVLAGSYPTEAVLALAGPSVEVTGYVTDEVLAGLYEQLRVAIVPLRFGAGVKGKVVEALSHALPLVTTSTGAQGIAGLGEVVPIHDDVPNLVRALAELLTDDEAWIKQSRAQAQFAQIRFSAEVMQSSVLKALESAEHAIRGRAVASE